MYHQRSRFPVGSIMESKKDRAPFEVFATERRRVFGMEWIICCVAALPAIVTAIQCHNAALQMTRSAKLAPSLIYGFVLWYWWAAIALLLWNIGKRRPNLWKISLRSTALQLAVGASLALLHLGLLHASIFLMIWRWPYLEGIGYRNLVFLTFERFGLELLLYVVAWAASAAIYMQITSQQAKLQTSELKQQLATAHLRALQMQLEPHFLFNTLNAITTLVRLRRNKEAVETLSHLNALLKSTLVQTAPEKVSVAVEVSAVENYLAIEQVRFADRLRIEMKIDPTALNGLIPCFLLQPLVENAIRHGISQCQNEGVIWTSIHRVNERLHLSVRDNGPGLVTQSSPLGHGIGLRNTEDRLAHFYPGAFELSAKPCAEGGFEVLIAIPYEQAGSVVELEATTGAA